MRLGEAFEKLYKGTLRPEEVPEVVRRLNMIDDHELTLAGWIGADKNPRVNSAWIGRTLLDMAGIQSNTEQDSNSFAVASGERVINGETIGAGDVLIGDNSTGAPNIFWDQSAGSFYLRNGTTVVGIMGTSEMLTGVGASVRRSTNLSINNATDTFVTWTTEVYDEANFIDLASHNTRVTIPETGKYWMQCLVTWEHTKTTGQRLINLYLNGGSDATITSQTGDTRNASGGVGFYSNNSFSCELSLTAGDYLEVNCHQTQGSAINISFANLQIRRAK